jgi:hypothetical protein
VEAEPEKEDDFYRIISLPVPENVILEVGGLTTLPDGSLAVCTRRGEVWIVSNPAVSGDAKPTYKRFAHGLHEPLGIGYRDGDLYVTQRSELTRLRDTDSDGRADAYDKGLFVAAVGQLPRVFVRPHLPAQRQHAGDPQPGLEQQQGPRREPGALAGLDARNHPAGRNDPHRHGHAFAGRLRHQRRGRRVLHRKPGRLGRAPAGCRTWRKGDFLGNAQGLAWSGLPGSR